MKARWLISQIYSYFLLAAFASCFFYLVVFLDLILAGGIFEPWALLINIISGIIFAVVLLPLQAKIQQFINRIFFNGYDPQTIIRDLALQLTSVIELQELFKILGRELKKVLDVKEISVLVFKDQPARRLFDGEESAVACLSSRCSTKYRSIDKHSPLYQQAQKTRRIITRGGLEEDDALVAAEMDLYKIEVIVPLLRRQKVIGLLLMGSKKFRRNFEIQDLEFLEVLSSQAAIAIENALLYRQFEQLNKDLKKQVKAKTTQLRKNNQRLKKLLKMKSDFLNIASHQLRTPVSVIRGMSSMLLRDAVPPAKRTEFIHGIQQKSRKLSQVVHDIITASELDNEDFRLEVSPLQLPALLEWLVSIRKERARLQKLKLSLEIEPRLPAVLANKHYLEQVLLNLIDNAFQYTPRGSITIQALVDKRDKKHVLIRISDTGIGIPKKDLPRIFGKFTRGTNASKIYTDGTGLGLFIIRRVMESHQDAEVYIEKTALGHGTTFVVSLPCVSRS